MIFLYLTILTQQQLDEFYSRGIRNFYVENEYSSLITPGDTVFFQGDTVTFSFLYHSEVEGNFLPTKDGKIVIGVPKADLNLVRNLSSYGYNLAVDKDTYHLLHLTLAMEKIGKTIYNGYISKLKREPDIRGFSQYFHHMYHELIEEDEMYKSFGESEEGRLKGEEDVSFSSSQLLEEVKRRQVDIKALTKAVKGRFELVDDKLFNTLPLLPSQSYSNFEVILTYYDKVLRGREEKRNRLLLFHSPFLQQFISFLNNPNLYQLTLNDFGKRIDGEWLERILSRYTDSINYTEKVKYAYREILQREADVPGLNVAVEQLESGSLSWGQFISNLLLSEEYCTCTDKQFLVKTVQEKIVGKNIPFEKERTKLRIKFACCMGVSGYCMASKLIFASLMKMEEEGKIEILTLPFDLYHFDVDKMDELDSFIISRYDHDQEYDYDVLVLHSVPNIWEKIIGKESMYHNLFKTYGITIWETDKLPKEWIQDLQQVDLVSVPSQWNKEVFERDIEHQVDLVYHPINTSLSKGIDGEEGRKGIIRDLVSDSTYVFYTINEWTGRKGVEDLITAFCQEFTKEDNVVLYLKVSGGCITKEAGIDYLTLIKEQYPNSPPVYLNWDYLSTEEIYQIHREGDCYITMTRSEGMGYGICEAIQFDRPVISGGFGAQKEYAPFVTYLDYEMVPANFCLRPVDKIRHKNCLESYCLFNPLYTYEQSWGRPLISQARERMREAYEERQEGNPKSKDYLIQNFNLEKVGRNFLYSLLNLIS